MRSVVVPVVGRLSWVRIPPLTQIKTKLMVKLTDRNNEEPYVGDVIVSSYLKYKRAKIRTGKITNFTPTGYVKFEDEDKVEHLCKTNQFYILKSL